MRWITLLLATAACGTSGSTPSAPTTPLESEAPTTESTAGLALGPAGTCAVGGTVTNAMTGEALAGVTIVLTFDDGTQQRILTEPEGTFIGHPRTAPVKLESFHGEKHVERPYGVGDCGVGIALKL